MPFSTLKRKRSLRDAWLDKVRQRSKETARKQAKVFQRKTGLKKQSASMRRRLAKYYPIKAEFLSRTENKWCAICIARRNDGEAVKIRAATEIHHSRGRNGSLLCDTRFFIPSCFHCRLFPHEQPEKARKLGLLSSPAEWNTPPEN